MGKKTLFESTQNRGVAGDRPCKSRPKTREEVAAFIAKQFANETIYNPEKRAYNHYGKLDLIELMDFIFDGPPVSEKEELSFKTSSYGKYYK